ncbi:angiotensin-converting enzyme-like [Saccoglossus kowalevskii]
MSSLGMFRLLAGLLVALSAGADAYSEEEAQEYLDNYNPRAQFFISEFALAGWDYSTNITHHNLEIVEVEGEEYAEFAAVAAEEANKFTPYLNDYTELVARELEFITDIGDAILDDDDFAHFDEPCTTGLFGLHILLLRVYVLVSVAWTHPARVHTQNKYSFRTS